MNVSELQPRPPHRENFDRKRDRFVPERSGCYVLTTFNGDVLYIGLAENLRRRMNDHLDNSAKTNPTAFGKAFWFYWIESAETNKVERTWMNIYIQSEGALPVLNKVYSPTFT
jgi:hypothetical protein